MSELFIVNLDSDLDGVYLSDLPAVNATPVARQIGFYLGSALTATSVASNLATYLGSFTVECGGGAATDISANFCDKGGVAWTTTVGTAYVSAAEDTAVTTTIGEAVGRLIATMALEIAAGTRSGALDIAAIQTEIGTSFGAAESDPTSGGGGVNVVCDNPAVCVLDADPSGPTIQGILRILAGAEPSGAGTFSEGANLGNHRLIGGTRRIYSRDRIDACIHEGSLSLYKSDTNFEGVAKDVQCLIFNESGVTQ